MPTSLNISLPDGLGDFVRQRVADQRFTDPGDYLRHLIEEDRRRLAERRLEAALLEGVSDDADPVSDTDWHAIRHEVRQRLGQ